jgi:hypothetical protein
LMVVMDKSRSEQGYLSKATVLYGICWQRGGDSGKDGV